MSTTRTVSAALLGLALAAGVASAKADIWRAQPYNHKGVVINTEEIKNDGKKIWFKLMVINNTGSVLMVDRNQLTAKLPDGSTQSRDRGTFAKWGKQDAYVIPAGGSHPLQIEFKVPTNALIRVALQLTGVSIDGKPVSLPDFVATP
jgi:hypothetical protein